MGRFYKGLTLTILLYRNYAAKILFDAASLSFYTIFSIIPLFMVIFSIFTNTPFFDNYYIELHNFIYQTLLPGKTSIIIRYIDILLKNSSKLGLIGALYGVLAVILFLGNFQYIINKIFNTDKERYLWHPLYTFCTLLGFIPMVLTVAIYVSIKLENFFNFTSYIHFFMIWLIFSIIYKVMPKRRVNVKAILIGSFVASIVWFTMRLYFTSYISDSNIYQTIYGPMNVILMFFIWIYITWIIVITGAYLITLLENFFQNKMEIKNNVNNSSH